MADVTFDGVNKLIIVNNGINYLNTIDIYSWWKEWFQLEDNSKFLQAFRTVGGDPIGSNQVVSPYFFLLNGWKIKPYEDDHLLTVNGNLFLDGGGNPFIPTIGNYNVLINLQTSSNSTVNTISTGSGLSQQQSLYLEELYKIHGLLAGSPLTVSPNNRTVSGINQTFTQNNDEVTVTRT